MDRTDGFVLLDDKHCSYTVPYSIILFRLKLRCNSQLYKIKMSTDVLMFICTELYFLPLLEQTDLVHACKKQGKQASVMVSQNKVT